MAAAQSQLPGFRARQYAGPHPALAAQQQPEQQAGGGAPADAAAAAAGAEHIEPDSGRCVLHFDVDCFYAQVEEVRDPSLRGRPVGVTQKYLVVTANYVARQQGVGKLMGVAEARRRCPGIALVSGEDLTPYRASSKSIQVVLRRFGPVERLGLDEFFLDATPEAQRRLAALQAAAGAGPLRLPPWQGHVHSSGTQLVQDSRHRPMDLRAVPSGAPAAGGEAPAAAVGGASGAAAAAAGGGSSEHGSGSGDSWEALLRLGSAIAAEARAAVLAETGCRASAGVAANKLLAKLCSGLHKPDDQTVLPPPEAAAFVAPLPVRALTGVGHKTEGQLQTLGIATAADLRAVPRAQLMSKFGERVGAALYGACRGQDASPVQEQGPPKSITVEDSFKSCASFAAAEKVVRVLAPDLLARLQEELQEEGRRPATLAVKWRLAHGGYQRASASCAMPQAVCGRAPWEQQVAALTAAAMALLRRSLREPFDLSLVNLGATGFSEGAAAAAAAGTRSITQMLAGGRREGSGGAAGAPAAGGAPSLQAQAQQQQQQQQHAHQQQQGASAWGKAAAAASAEQRRSYSAAPQQAPLLSKRQERQLREQPLAGATAPAGPAAVWQPQPPDSLPAQHAQHSRDEWGLRDGWGDEAAEEEDDGFWGDLAAFHSSGSGSGGRQKRSPAAPTPAADATNRVQQLPAAMVGQPLLSTVAGGIGAAGAAAWAGQAGGRVVLHCDVDSFYVAVERMDDPSLCGVPLAVQQFNAGGFVAVSYEARAAGIRCGDGAGAAGRAAVPHLVCMQAVSVEECRRRCPGLVVRPMRTDRYREVAQQIHALLRTFAPDGQVEKTSYDDFYLQLSPACGSASFTSSLGGTGTRSAAAAGTLPAAQQQQQQQQQPPDSLLFLPADPVAAQSPPPPQQPGQPPQGRPPPDPQQAQRQWGQLAPDLQHGALLAAAVRAALKQQLGITVSCGVARNKLLARLASPCGKPDGLAVVPDGAERAFIARVPLHKVPQLRGKFGQEVASQLGVSTVGQLAGMPRHELVRRYGEQRGAFLAALPLAQDDSPVRERGPQKSLAAERSFPPLPSEAAAAAELAPLAHTLLARAAEDSREHRRLPAKLVVSYRQGYGSNPRSKSAGLPAVALRWLQVATEQQQEAQPAARAEEQAAGEPASASAAAEALVAAALGLLRPTVASTGWQLTRLAVAFAYAEGDSSGPQRAAPEPGQTSLGAFVQRGPGNAEAAAPAKLPAELVQPARPRELRAAQQQQQQQQQREEAAVRHAGAQLAAKPQQPAARPASYRNAEALAIQQLFGSDGGGSAGPGAGAPQVPAELPPEERASLELALKLQQEEAQAAAAQAAARKRGAVTAGDGGARGGGKAKQQRRGSGPLDAFFKRGS